MSTPRRLQRQRTKGWRMPFAAVYVGRPTKWGNPYVPGVQAQIAVLGADDLLYDMSTTLTVEQAVECYRTLMDVRLAIFGDEHPDDLVIAEQWRLDVASLRGRDLVCWCSLDVPCHADVLLELANA